MTRAGMTRAEEIRFWSRIERKARERYLRAVAMDRAHGYDLFTDYERCLAAHRTLAWAQRHLDALIMPAGAARVILAR